MKTKDTMSPAQKRRTVLRVAQKRGYLRISFGMSHKSIPQSVSFCFGASSSIFAWPTTNRQRHQGWPAIWDIVRDIPGLGAGCGNSHQYQAKLEGINPSVWHITNGKWKLVAGTR